MNIRELIALPREEIVALALDGKLSPRQIWVAMKGAGKYAAAVAGGDIASDDDAALRAATCQRCLSHTEAPALATGAVKVFCGPAFEERYNTALPTCGCLVALTIDGATTPAGATCVASYECPQGRWGKVTPKPE